MIYFLPNNAEKNLVFFLKIRFIWKRHICLNSKILFISKSFIIYTLKSKALLRRTFNDTNNSHKCHFTFLKERISYLWIKKQQHYFTLFERIKWHLFDLCRWELIIKKIHSTKFFFSFYFYPICDISCRNGLDSMVRLNFINNNKNRKPIVYIRKVYTGIDPGR